jgi:hypothetical protein
MQSEKEMQRWAYRGSRDVALRESGAIIILSELFGEYATAFDPEECSDTLSAVDTSAKVHCMYPDVETNDVYMRAASD